LNQANEVIAQADGPPLGGAYPTSWWYPGQVIEDVHDLRSGDLPSGEIRVAVGMYLLASGERLEVRDERGAAVAGEQIMIRTTLQRAN